MTRSLTWAAALLLSGTAAAHDFHMGIADISFNAGTGATEIVHTYTAHDVEALLGNLYQRQFDLSDQRDQAAFAKYLDKRFYLLVDGKRVVPALVGMTIKIDSVTVLQELEKTALPATALLHDGVLTDFLPAQLNTVNVNLGDGLRTLTFDAAHGEQPLR